MRGRLVVVQHDVRWAGIFDAESKKVMKALGPNVVAIHHIGSTAIPGIYAKPIIDMLVEVTVIEHVDSRNPQMATLGYEAMGELGIDGRRYFRKDNTQGIRTHQVHTFLAGCSEIIRHLAFRDFMRAHPDWAQQYSDLKRKLAEAHADSLEQYMDGKDAFIKEVDRKAALWQANQ